MEKQEIIYGRNAVLEYLKRASKGERIQLHISEKAHGKIIEAIKREAKQKGVKAVFKDKRFFEAIGTSSTHQGVSLVIEGERKKSDSLQSFITKVAEKRGLLVLLDHLTDPQNVGSIIRSTEALGGAGVILPKAHASGVTPTVVKAAAGATAHLDIRTITNVADFINQAKARDFWIIGTSDHGDKSISEVSDMRPAVLVIGSEGTGMRHLTEELCDHVVSIPLKGNVSSLNASVSAGILLFEILKES